VRRKGDRCGGAWGGRCGAPWTGIAGRKGGLKRGSLRAPGITSPPDGKIVRAASWAGTA
jgi:hypothetical protein